MLSTNLIKEVSRLLSFHQWLYAGQHFVELLKLHHITCALNYELLQADVLTMHFQTQLG
jgi:hypothetical protein